MKDESLTTYVGAEAVYINLFKALPSNSILLRTDAPRYTIVAATLKYLKNPRAESEDLIGKGVFEAFPSNPTDPNDTGARELRVSLEHVLRYKELHQIPMQRYDSVDEKGGFVERYWNASNSPVFTDEGEVAYIIHTAEEITNRVKAEKREDAIRGIEAAYNFFMNAPVIIGFVKGPEYVIELANEGLLEVWGRTSEVIGKPLMQAIPELESQGFKALLDQVCATGEPFYAYEYPITLHRDGRDEVIYFDFVYKPFYENGSDSRASGVFSVGHDFTAQMLARQRVEESNREFQFVTDFMPQMIWLTNPDGYHYYYNKQWYDYTGLTHGETEGEGWNNVFHPDDQERAWKVWRYSLDTGEPYEIEYRCRRFDGTYRWFLGRALPLKDDTGAILKWFGTCTDIDDQKKSAEKLEQSEARTRLAVEAAHLGTFEINVTEQTIIHSSRTAEIIGLDPTKQWAYQAFINAIHPDDLEIRKKAYEEARRTGKLLYEARIILPDRSLRWIRLNGVYMDQGNGPLIIGTKMDITEERKAAELLERKIVERTRELEAQKSLMNNILTNSSNGISVTEMIRNENGKVIDASTILANDAAVKYIGLPKEVYLSKRAKELDPNMLSSPYGQTCLKTLETGEPSLIQYYLEITGRWLELTISKMDDDHLIHIFTDVTPIKESQLQLERTIEELQRSNQNLEEFAHAASHDLKEPIRKVQVFSDVLKRSFSSLNEEQLRLFERVEDATQRMSLLINDLLDYSHVSMGVDLLEEINLNKKVAMVLKDLEILIQEKDGHITVGTLPTIKGHRRQMQQLFHNLIQNALKYSKKDTPPQIKITSAVVRSNETSFDLLEEEKNRLFHLLTIKDNGIGFDQEHATQIFQMFKRLHGKGEYQGSGVGLAIVKRVVENHNGYIRAEGKPGEGAVFEILLPVEW